MFGLMDCWSDVVLDEKTAHELAHDLLPPGKLPSALLQRLLRQYTNPSNNILIGAGLGRDAAVIQLEDRLLIAKTDPITFVAENIGYYAVHINANDVVCMGGEPKWFMATVLLPEHKADAALVEQIFRQINEACVALEISWCGGHTEITSAVTQPVVIGMLLGEAPLTRRYSPAQIQAGDQLILTKGLAVEATAILGREKSAALAEIFEADFAQHCHEFLYKPGLSVLPEARLAWQVPGIHALHDPTEGGLASAVLELLAEKKFGVELDGARIPLFPETKLLCEQFGLDPLGLISSGALLLVGEAQACEQVLAQYHAANIPAANIGRVLPEGEGHWLIEENERHELPLFHRDEILRVL